MSKDAIFLFDDIAIFDVMISTGTQKTSSYLIVFVFLSIFPRVIMRPWWLTRKIIKEILCRRFLLSWFKHPNYERAELLLSVGGKSCVSENRDFERGKYFYKKGSPLERSQTKTAMRVELWCRVKTVSSTTGWLIQVLFLVSFLLLLHVQKSFSQQHVYLLWGHRPYIEDNNAEIFVFITVIYLAV